MRKPFINENFLLTNALAERLFHEVAATLPIIDYHNHLNPVHLAEDHQYSNICQMWLAADPYKHRAMRINGVPECFISGDANDKEKFLKWAETLTATLGGPLFHWSCMELRQVFGIDVILSPQNANEIWDECNQRLANDDMGARSLLKRYKVETLCTSDDLLANLEIHKQVQEIEVLPSLRGDALLQVEAEGYLEMMNRLSEMTGINIASWDDCKTALSRRLDDFGQAGCVLADHSLDDGFDFVFASEAHAGRLFKSILAGEKPEPLEAMQIKTALLFFLAGEYAKRGWVMQLHLGALRQTSRRLRKLAGRAGGYAGIGSPPSIATLVRFMDELEQQCLLPKTILYTLNPSYNEQLAVLTGSFSEDHVPGKIQLGPAWWFNDHFAGIRQHLQVLANYSLLSRFIGMTTDSRTVLSFSRHEYFRRILCNMLGEWVEQKLIPEDYSLLRELVEQISCKNIRNYLNKGK